ncbi:RB1-inducible coiled-coil protein 1 isoform X2 [Folsomia candida]|nr:RB1-inducible coiled-coil protein 1 isoform X2 [Folsomia candida]
MKVSKEILASSERLIHDQYLQHLGWGAVVANLEDIVSVFKKRVEKFENDFWKEFDIGEGGLELDVVEGLPTTIESLATISMPTELSTNSSNLLQWLNTTTTNSSSLILSLPSQYAKTMEVLDKSVIEGLLKDSTSTISKSTLPSMKQIKGLSHRLYSLDQLLLASRSTIGDSTTLCASLLATTQRATSLADNNILPTLSESHLKQLHAMVENLLKIQDINKRCSKAKEELLGNLNTRLKWVIFVQKQISELNLKLSVYSEALRKFKNLKSVIKQVDIASSVFASCVDEVARRRNFETKYNRDLIKVQLNLKQDFQHEREQRKSFHGKFKNHFLYNTLFEKLGSENGSEFWWEGFDPESEEFKKMVAMEIEQNLENVAMETDKLKECQEKIQNLNEEHAREILELRENYEKRIWEMKEEFKNEVEAVKSRFKFVAKQQQQLEIISETETPVKIGGQQQQIEEEEHVPGIVDSLSRKLSLTSTGPCKIGDRVLLYYNEKYEAFVVHGNNGGSVHFVHTENAMEMKKEFCYLGSVLDKEYCVARRAQNRYKVPQGFHFYRVKVLLAENFILN